MDNPSQPVRIAITADLHYDPTGYLTSPSQITAMVEQIAAEAPDAVIIAGDLGHGRAVFEGCLACFADLPMPVGVITGNHDVWSDRKGGYSSLVLWKQLLPGVVKDAGFLWLEEENLYLRHVAVVGSMVWYDYSAIDPGISLSVGEIATQKMNLNNDAIKIDWPYTDPEFARILEAGLVERLARAAGSDAVTDILVVTHVPILEEQLVRKPSYPQWAISNAYFGNLTTGHKVLAEPKVRAVVSGHTHVGQHGSVRRVNSRPVSYTVVDSDYGRPEYVIVEL